jgi:GntR family transcriptional regulator
VPSHPGGTLAPAYQFLRRLHRRGGVPYLIGRTWVDRRIYDDVGKKGFTTTTPLRVLEDAVGDRLGRAEQTVVVGSADLEVADLLRVPINAPIVILKRSVFDADDVLIYESEGRHRGDFVRLRMKLR